MALAPRQLRMLARAVSAGESAESAAVRLGLGLDAAPEQGTPERAALDAEVARQAAAADGVPDRAWALLQMRAEHADAMRPHDPGDPRRADPARAPERLAALRAIAKAALP